MTSDRRDSDVATRKDGRRTRQPPAIEEAMTTLSSLEKGLRLLRELAMSEGGMAPAELAQTTGLNRTTVYRLCELLQRGGWVQRLGDEREMARIDLGAAFQGLAVLVTNKYKMEAQLRPILTNLSRALDETVHLAILERDQIVHVARELPDDGLNLAAGIGSRAQAHTSALGKALLATLPDEEIRRMYVGARLPTTTATSISTVSALIAELGRIRERGYAVDNEESRLGIKCVAAPVFGVSRDALFALSVTTVPQRLTGDAFDRAVDAVKGAASLATASFGGTVAPEWRHSGL